MLLGTRVRRKRFLNERIMVSASVSFEKSKLPAYIELRLGWLTKLARPNPRGYNTSLFQGGLGQEAYIPKKHPVIPTLG